LNAKQLFSLSQNDETFTLKLNPTWRGTYRYNVRFVFGDDIFTKGTGEQRGRFRIAETFCDTGSVIGQADIELKAGPNEATYSPLGRYGKEINLPLGQKREAVCINVTVLELSKPILPNASLNVFASNTRPCWFIECLLD